MASFQLVVICIVFVSCSMLTWANRRVSTNLIAVVVLLALMSLRPGIAGETLGPVGAGLLAVLVLFVFRDELRGAPPGRQALALILVQLYVVLGARAISIDGSLISGLVVTPLVAAAGLGLGRRRGAAQAFVRVCSLLAAHQVLALVVSQQFGLPTRVIVSDVSGRRGWEYSLSVLGSVTVGSGGVFKVFSDRLTGPFGEPGVFASFAAIVAAVSMVISRRWVGSIQIPLLAAILLSQSVAGLGLYVVALGGFLGVRWLGTGRRFSAMHYIAFGAVMAIALAVATRPDGLLAAKRAANPESFDQRLGGASLGELAATWISRPFGQGGSLGINLVQSTVALGLPILVLGLWLYAAPLRGPAGGRVAPAVAVVTLTVLFSQPPMLYSWVLVAFLLGGLSERDGVPDPGVDEHGRTGASARRANAT